MSNESSFPSRDLLDVIKKYERMDSKLDQILDAQKDTREKIGNHEARLIALEKESVRGRAYVAGASAVGGAGMTFLIPFIRSKLGI